MPETKKINVVLFALTGFGNAVLKALLADPRVHVRAVLTVKYSAPFPHYAEQHLNVLCDERQIPWFSGVKVGSAEGIGLLRQFAPDLIVVATFKQILTQNVLDVPALGVVNFHPSLLPRFRGPCPTNAALLSDEPVTGVTAHYITPGLDEGDILLQRSVDITAIENDGRLRHLLANTAAEMVPALVDLFAGFTRPAGTVQDHQLATPAAKPAVEDGYLETARDIAVVCRKVRALNPVPGTSILVGTQRVAVDRSETLPDTRPDGLYESAHAVDLVINAQAVRLYKQTAPVAV